MNRRMSALVVESEPEVRRAIVEALQGFYDVNAIGSIPDAIARISGKKHAIVFAGGKAVERLIVPARNAGVGIVAVFTKPDSAREAELIESGAEAVITYPFAPRLIRALAERVRLRASKDVRISRTVGALREFYIHLLGGDLRGICAPDDAVKGDAPLLIIGEPGTGKGLLARSIHLAGSRALMPFEALDARNSPSRELPRAIFGAGGAIERASGGTLLIHGIGEISLKTQEQLLGAVRDGRRDVRFIFTTRIDLHGAALREEFDGRLWSVFESSSFSVPALREKPDAVPALAERLLHWHANRLSSPAKGFHASARKLLMSHPWPGNLVELERVVLLAAARAGSALIAAEDMVEIHPVSKFTGLDDLPLEGILEHKLTPLVATLDELDNAGLYDLIVSRVEKPLLKLVMEKVGGNQLKASKALGIHRNTLRKKLKQLGIRQG